MFTCFSRDNLNIIWKAHEWSAIIQTSKYAPIFQTVNSSLASESGT
ncbi:hypothetical protein [Acinetobacter indicus]|nr:hypothetical protein [Acinetobacter indicus]MCO8100927.1 hypothetical protein [Acinetobacter indicus]MCO8106512.1 hypothetical protein [Acinetobacter indicus]